MIFKDFLQTGYIYHLIDINEYGNIVKNGILLEENCINNKYKVLNDFLDEYKLNNIPNWVKRGTAIFGSMNYGCCHNFHSHSVLLGIRIDEERCWIANEKLANSIYEPLVLSHVDEFSFIKKYIENEGIQIAKKYWNSSLSFKENKTLRVDRDSDYDAEVLIFHNILPEAIIPLYIITDSKMYTIEEWKRIF